jgi:hypothetical protein
MLNIFSLHGKYFQDHENRFTANVLFLLSESRSDFLPEFLKLVGIDPHALNLSKADFIFQSNVVTENGREIPDAEIKLGDDLHLVLEAKIGRNLLSLTQLRGYATRLGISTARRRKLVCITQVNEQVAFNRMKAEIEPTIVKPGTCVLLQWHQLLSSLRSCKGLSDTKLIALNRGVSRGRSLDCSTRLAALFLEEVENNMYERKIVADLPAGELADVTVTTQNPWFMEMARKHRVWFPSGQTKYGLGPARYVAYYETQQVGNPNPKQISYVARNLIFWNRITMDDARQCPELETLFEDENAVAEMSSWYDRGETLHIALTEKPIKLRRPIPLGKRNVARVLSKRRYSFPVLLNASTIDDLF